MLVFAASAKLSAVLSEGGPGSWSAAWDGAGVVAPALVENPGAGGVVNVDLVAVVPLHNVSVSVDASEQLHGTVLVAVVVGEHGLLDVGAVAPEDGPEVLVGV